MARSFATDKKSYNFKIGYALFLLVWWLDTFRGIDGRQKWDVQIKMEYFQIPKKKLTKKSIVEHFYAYILKYNESMPKF